MPTPATEQNGLGATAKDVAERASALVRLELELATLELKKKATNLGVGAGLGVAAALFAIAAILGLVAVNRIQKGSPPVPEQAIREAKLTTNALKSDGN